MRKSDVLLQMSACHTPLSGGREEPVSRQRSRMTKMLTPYKRGWASLPERLDAPGPGVASSAGATAMVPTGYGSPPNQT